MPPAKPTHCIFPFPTEVIQITLTKAVLTKIAQHLERWFAPSERKGLATELSELLASAKTS